MAEPNPWNSKSLDQLNGRVEDLENEREALSLLPTRVAELSGRIDTLVEIERRAREDSVRRQEQDSQWRQRIEGIVHQNFEKVHVDHAQSARTLQQLKDPPRSPWDRFKDTMAWLGPIIVALIGAYVLLKTGQQPGP